MKFSKLAFFGAATAAVLATVVAGALTLGGPHAPPPMASINDPFRAVDFSDLPALRHYPGRDDAQLAYRAYPPAGAVPQGSVVLVHGSSASSNSMHILAKALAGAGYATYALDMRGHGDSGTKGQITYIGQLEDDLASFVKAVNLPKPSTLAGFSAGGGFVLRFTGSTRRDMFDSCLLLSPFLGEQAANFRPGSGGWIDVGVPRVVALATLNAVGIHALNHLSVVEFALNGPARQMLTPSYSFALAANFRPQRDYEANLQAVHRPCVVLAGANDEAFDTAQLEGILRQHGKNWPVTLLPGIGHIPLIVDAAAVDATVKALATLRAHGA